MANILTVIRIMCSLLILAFPAYSKLFYVFYLIGGFTDAIDGTVARKTGKETEFGAKFDTVADVIFVIVCFIKLLPIFNFATWMLIWIGIILAIKIINIVSGIIIQKKFVAVHSVLNKITGALLFALPLTIKIIDLKYSLIVVCTVATFAAIQENYHIRTDRRRKHD